MLYTHELVLQYVGHEPDDCQLVYLSDQEDRFICMATRLFARWQSYATCVRFFLHLCVTTLNVIFYFMVYGG